MGRMQLSLRRLKMLFSSSVFLFLFLPVVMILYYNPFFKKRGFRNLLLLFASLFFYAWGEPVFVFLMMASIGINWFFVLQMDQSSRKKKWLFICIILNIALLFIFKYLVFFLKNVDWLFRTDLSHISIGLPLGISFFTFQIMSYVLDVYYGKVAAQKRLYKFALYVSMFPQLVAGPIVRYEQIEEEIDNRRENLEDFSLGMVRFVYGLAKKVLISNYMAVIADNMFYLSKNGGISAGSAWLGIICYTLQIYFDFSGYSDMAIGLGHMLGFHFPENFDYPFTAKSVTEYWRRWHISLSSWFRDYVYIPLGGNRKGVKRTYFNTFLVWLLTGIWHGANWTFIIWGLGHFAFIMLERLTGITKGLKYVGRFYTMAVVTLLFVTFRAEDLGSAGLYYSQLFGGSGVFWDNTASSSLSGSWLVILLAMVFSYPVAKMAANRLNLKEETRRNLSAIAAVPLFLFCIAKCLASAYSPFIYFNF